MAESGPRGLGGQNEHHLLLSLGHPKMSPPFLVVSQMTERVRKCGLPPLPSTHRFSAPRFRGLALAFCLRKEQIRSRASFRNRRQSSRPIIIDEKLQIKDVDISLN